MPCYSHYSCRATIVVRATPLTLFMLCYRHRLCQATIIVHAKVPSLLMQCTVADLAMPLSLPMQHYATVRAMLSSMFMTFHSHCSCHTIITVHTTLLSLFMQSHSHRHAILMCHATTLSLFKPCHYHSSFRTTSTVHHATITAHATPLKMLT